MTSTTVTMAPPHPAPTLERIATWLLLLFVASLQMSIFAAQILLTLMLICWVALLARDRARPSAPAFLLPLLIYGVLTLVSSAFTAVM